MAEKEDLTGLPEQVRKQNEEADKIQQELLGQKDEPKDDSEEQEEEPQVKPGEVDEPEEEPAEEPGEGVEPQDKKDETPESDGEPEKSKTPGCSCGFEHKYKVLKGKYDKEVPRLHREAKRLRGILEDNQGIFQGLTEEIKNLKNENESLKSAGARPAEKGGAAPEIEELNPEEYEPYGDEIVKLVKAVNAQRGADSNRIQELESEISELRQGSSRSDVDRYMDRLNAAIPDWEDINRDPDFIDWTNETHVPYTDITINAMLNEANRQLDHKQVIKIFKSYMDQNQRDSEPKDDPKPQPKPRKRLKKEEYVVPKQEPDGRHPRETSKGSQYSADDISKAASDFAKGRITEEEFNAMCDSFQSGQTQ